MRHSNKKINYKKIILRILILIFLVSIILIAYLGFNKYKSKKENEELNNYINNNVQEEKTTSEKSERMLKVEELQKENSDIVGWLEIPDSNINYPVVQGQDNDYYMVHDYKKEYSKNGSLFLDKDYNWDKPSTNLLIYGHNNRGTDSMFCQLLNYKKQSYYDTHKKFRFTTNKEDAEYEIISVFQSKVYYKNETNVFRYYYFIDADSEKEFNDYVNNSKKASLYDTGVTAEYGDQLMTLSTCDFYTEDGRLAVVAKKIENE